MSFTHMGAGMASPDASSSQMYRRGVLIHCPPEYSVDIVPPMKEGSSWHYGLRVKPLPSVATSPSGGAPVDAKGKRIRGYEIHRKWEDCLDLQRILEKEYSTLAKARRNRWGGGKKGNSVYGRPERAASFDSLPTGPDPKTIPTDIHAFIPRLAAKSSLFRGALGSALVQQRSEEFNEFISALFAPGTPNLVDETRQTPAVREWFGFWRRDRDAMRRRDSDRASIAPSTRRVSIAASEVPPLPTGDQNVPTPPPTSSPLAQTSYESSPISLDSQDDPRQSHETTYGDLAAALDTFPMPPTPMDGPVAIEAQSPKSSAQPISGLGTEFVPIIQRRLGFARGNTARNAAFRNAQFFSDPPTPPLPPLPVSVAPSDDGGSENDAHQFKTIRGPQTAPRTDDGEMGVHNGSPRRAASPSMSSASTTFTRQTTSPRSSQTSDWSMGLSSSIVKALSGTTTSGGARERDEPAPHADEQNEIDRMRRMTLSSLSSNSSKRPPPVPPRSILRRSYSGAAIRPRKHSDASAIARYPVPPVPSDVPTVVYDEGEPEFEIVTHMVLNSYLDDRRSSLLSSAISSNSGSSIRRSMTPSIVSAYSTSSAGRESISSAVPSGSGPAPSSPLPVPTPSTAVPPGSVPANEIIIKAVCRVGDSIVLCRVQRSLPLEAVRGVLATKFKQAAGVQLNLLEHGFVLGYLGSQLRPGGPGTAGGRPGTAGGLSASAVTPARPSGRPGTAPGRPRSSSLSSAAACADPTHLTLIVTQRDWENAVAKHGEKMTVQVLLAGAD